MVSKWDFVVRNLPGGNAVVYVYDEYGDEVGEFVADTKEEALELAEQAAAKVGAVLSKLGTAIANASLDVVRGLGSAIIDGLDNAFDAVGEKLSGKEPAVIAGITTATIGLLTVILLFHTAKKGL